VKSTAAILLAAAALSCAAQAQTTKPAATPNPGNVTNPDDPVVKAATSAGGEAAARWLALADAGQWDASWNALAPAVQQQIGKDDFVSSVSAVRNQYGAVKARRARTVTFTHSLPGTPPGDYVVLQYDTDFANGAHAIETVTPMRTADGSWKVSGYYVR
jgi:hypothetical protein